MVTGWANGEPDSPLRLDLDWYLPSLAEGTGPVLYVSLRGNGNVNQAQVAVGGPGRVAVPRQGDEWASLGFPVRSGRWGHLTVVSDPVSRGAAGAYDVTISQGDESAEYPNLPFRPDWRGDFPQALWCTPVLHVGGGSPARPAEAYVTNVTLSTSHPRESGD